MQTYTNTNMGLQQISNLPTVFTKKSIFSEFLRAVWLHVNWALMSAYMSISLLENVAKRDRRKNFLSWPTCRLKAV